MKKLITGLVLGAICCALFGTPAFPLKYDPRYHTETTNINDAHSSGDDTPWGEPLDAYQPNVNDRVFDFFVGGITLPGSIWFRYVIERIVKGKPRILIDDNGRTSDTTSDPSQGSIR